MSLIKQLQQALGSAEGTEGYGGGVDEKRLEITLYSNDEICIFINEKRIPICVFPLTEVFYCDPEEYDIHLSFDDIISIHEVMAIIADNMDELKEWVEEF